MLFEQFQPDLITKPHNIWVNEMATLKHSVVYPVDTNIYVRNTKKIKPNGVSDVLYSLYEMPSFLIGEVGFNGKTLSFGNESVHVFQSLRIGNFLNIDIAQSFFQLFGDIVRIDEGDFLRDGENIEGRLANPVSAS